MVAKIEFEQSNPGALEKVKLRLNEFAGVTLRIGVVGPEAQEFHRDRITGEPDDLTVMEIAAIHEFGLGRNPERAFIRPTIATELASIRGIYGAGMRKVRAGQKTPRDVLDDIGARVSLQMKRRILTGLQPSLAPLTAAQKERDPRSLPLLDTGQIMNAIGWEIRADGT